MVRELLSGHCEQVVQPRGLKQNDKGILSAADVKYATPMSLHADDDGPRRRSRRLVVRSDKDDPLPENEFQKRSGTGVHGVDDDRVAEVSVALRVVTHQLLESGRRPD